jgi:molecular chaperone DnaJ
MAPQDWVDKDFYKILGVSKKSSQPEIKKAYRKLAQDLHPDKNPDNKKAEERFKGVSEAYAVLQDKTKRKEYDEARSMFGGGFKFPGSGGNRAPQGGGGGVGDVFGGATGNLGDLFGGLFNRGGGQDAGSGGGQRAGRRGADVETEATISFNDALNGVTIPLRLTGEGACPTCHGTGAKTGTVPRVCPSCEGTGSTARNAGGFAFAEPCVLCKGRGLVVEDPCLTCHGSGRAMTSRTVQTRIPGGVKDGSRIRLAGKGAPGEGGGPAGDLYVIVHVASHPVFGRSGDHVTVGVPVTFPEAALGAQVRVPVPGGRSVTLKIPAGTSNGRTFRVRGRGVRRRDGTNGDVLATVEVEVPKELDTKSRAALETYQQSRPSVDVRAELMNKAGVVGAGS